MSETIMTLKLETKASFGSPCIGRSSRIHLLLLAVVTALLFTSAKSGTWTSRQIYYGATNTDPTWFDHTISGSGDFYNFTQFRPLMCFTTGSAVANPAQRLKCFSIDGTVVGGINPSFTNVFSLAMKESGQVLISGRTSTLAIYNIAVSGTTVTLTSANTVDVSALSIRVAKSINRENTNFFFFGPSTFTAGAPKFHRYDRTLNTLTSGATLSALDASSDTYNLHIWKNQFIIATGYYKKIAIGDLSSLGETKAMTLIAGVYASRLDNLNENILFCGDIDNYVLKNYDISGATVTNTRSLTDPDNSDMVDIFNMGSLNFLMYLNNFGAAKPRIVSKADLTILTRVDMPFIPMIAAGIGLNAIDPDWSHFAAIASTGSGPYSGGLMSMYLLNDECRIRDATSKICSACYNGFYLNTTNTAWNLCWALSRFPDGKGLNPSSGLVVSCEAGCGSCLQNVNNCTRCLYSDGYYRIVEGSSSNSTAKCYLYKDIPIGYGVNPLNNSEVIVCKSSLCTSCKGNANTCESLGSTSVDSNTQGLESSFEDDKDEYSMTSRVLQWILKLINFIFKVGLMPLDFFLGSVIDRHTAFFSYLRVLDGTPMLYPNKIIHFLSSVTFFGFRAPNPHWDWSKDLECRVPYNYLVRGMHCNIFANYGHNINILWASLFVSSTVFLLCHFLLKKKPESKTLQVINKNFGWRYFFVFMDAVVLELFGLCILNFSKVERKTSAIDGGFAFSFILLVFYVAFYAATFVAIKSWLDARKAKGADEEMRPGQGDQRLALFTFIIEDYKPKQMTNFFYYMPLVLAGKQMLVQILALSLSGEEWGQLVPIVIVEIAYLVVLCIARPKESLIRNIFDIFFASIAPIYIFANMGSLTKVMSNEDKQNNAGKAMASFLLICALITTSYVFLRVALAITSFLKAGKASSKVSSTSGPSNNERNENPDSRPSTDHAKLLESKNDTGRHETPDASPHKKDAKILPLNALSAEEKQ